jgi:hypothetical protein
MDQGSKRAKKARCVEVVTPEKTNKAENSKLKGKFDTIRKRTFAFQQQLLEENGGQG